MKNRFRSRCPITSALDIIGDKWSLVIIKQIIFEEKATFKDFIESPESVATNILTTRLKMLEEYNLIEKQKLPCNKKTNIYTLTEKGLGLIPVVTELSIWSKHHINDFNPELNLDDRLDWVEKNRVKAFKKIKNRYMEFKDSLFAAKV